MNSHVIFEVTYVYGLIFTVFFRALVYGAIVGFHMRSKLQLPHVFLFASYQVALEHGFSFVFDQVCL